MALPSNLKRKPGLFGSMAAQQPAMTAEPMQMAAPRKPGFFGEGGAGRAIAGNIGDALLQFSGMQPIYQPAMAEQRAMQLRAAERAQDFRDQMALADFKAKNREPTSYEQILNAAGIQGAERIGLLRRKAENDANGVPVGIDVQNADGSVTRQYVRPGTLGGSQQGGVPDAAVSALRANPALKDQFNQKYGPGAAERYLGGSSGNAGGNF